MQIFVSNEYEGRTNILSKIKIYEILVKAHSQHSINQTSMSSLVFDFSS